MYFWGYRSLGGPTKHAGDIFLMFNNKEIIGVSLESRGTLVQKNIVKYYVATQYKALKKESS